MNFVHYKGFDGVEHVADRLSTSEDGSSVLVVYTISDMADVAPMQTVRAKKGSEVGEWHDAGDHIRQLLPG